MNAPQPRRPRRAGTAHALDVVPRTVRLSTGWSAVLLFLSVLPTLLVLYDVDLGARPPVEGSFAASLDPELGRVVVGRLIESIIGWSGVTVTLLTGLLATVHYRSTGSVTTAVLGIAIVGAGAFDAFRILAANGFLMGTFPHAEREIAYVLWVARVGQISVLLGAVLALLLRGEVGPETRRRWDGVAVGIFALGTGLFFAIGVALSDTPPWDLVRSHQELPLAGLPLALLLVAGVFVFPALHARSPTLLSHALALAAVPMIGQELHFGLSDGLYDGHFVASELLRVLGFTVPLVGLSLDIARMYGRRDTAAVRLENEIVLRKRIEERLWSSEARGEAILANIAEGVVTLAGDGTIEGLNGAAEQMLGYAPGEALGLRAEVLAGGAWPEALHRRLGGEELTWPPGRLRPFFEVPARRKDGSTFPAEASLTQFETGGTPRWAAVLRDVSEGRAAQEALRRRTEELGRSNAELEKFAYVASHDLQEPLRMVASFADLLGRRYRGRLDEDADEWIGFIVDGVERMRTLIHDLLAFSRVGAADESLGLVSLRDAYETAAARVRASLEEAGAEVEVSELPDVHGDPVQLAQVFQNLLSNAVKFRGDRPLRIRVLAEEEGEVVCISISDNGIGFDMAYADKVFELFQRLHTPDQYAGTGIGLALCRKIVERHGGEISVESVPGEGATFRFTLPSSRAALRRMAGPPHTF